jgi:hypothetical protein
MLEDIMLPCIMLSHEILEPNDGDAAAGPVAGGRRVGRAVGAASNWQDPAVVGVVPTERRALCEPWRFSRSLHLRSFETSKWIGILTLSPFRLTPLPLSLH